MTFKDRYTTEAIKTAVSINKDKTADEKILETEKVIVSNDAFLQAEMIEALINKIEHARISGLMGHR